MPSNRLKGLLAAFLAFTCVCFNPATAQEQRARVIQRISLPNEPVDGLEVEVGGRAVKLNSLFTAGREWLKGLKIKAKNISERHIVFAQVHIDVPKSGTMEYPLGIPVTYGQLPAVDAPPAPAEKLVAPGQVFKLALSDQTFDTVMNLLAEHQVTDVVEAKISHMMIVFDDGSAWNNGNRLRRDLSQPYRWKNVWHKGTSPTGATFQKISWKRPHRSLALPAAADDVHVQCYRYFYYDYVLCGTETGNNACIAPDASPRTRESDDYFGEPQYLASKTVACEGANCSGKSTTVRRAESSPMCGYSGGNAWQ